jgi:hypothetical protein
MNILKGNILKGFAAVAMLCMIGAVFANSASFGWSKLAAEAYINYNEYKDHHYTSMAVLAPFTGYDCFVAYELIGAGLCAGPIGVGIIPIACGVAI